MSSSSDSTTVNEQCEHCHSAYSLIKRKKYCAVCRKFFCSNCVTREYYNDHSYRICLICQLISNNTTTDSQLLELKVKHLRDYLQAKGISYHTCTEKQELVDLIKRNRHLPFTRLSTQPTQTSPIINNTTSTTTPPSPKSSNNSGPFTNLQHTVSSFANQVNNFASNIQDYVTNTASTVSDVINHAFVDQPTTTNNNPNNGSFNPSFSAPRSSPHTTSNPQQQQRPPPSQAAAATASSTSTKKTTNTSKIS